MADQTTSLAALIGSRICHDLISPIGAINNGLELLSMSGDVHGPEIELIGESVGNASARIRFFRVAFGAAGDQMMSPAEVRSILQDLYGKSRLNIAWSIETPVERHSVRMAFLAILCTETAFPYGGQISVRSLGRRWELSGKADRGNVDPDLWALLERDAPRQDLPAAHVQFALLSKVSAESSRPITLQSSATSLNIQY